MQDTKHRARLTRRSSEDGSEARVSSLPPIILIEKAPPASPSRREASNSETRRANDDAVVRNRTQFRGAVNLPSFGNASTTPDYPSP